MAGNPKDYDVKTCAPGDLTKADLAACVAIIESGEAVDPAAARAELPRSRLLAIARTEDRIVGVGAIKRARPHYASQIAKRSGQTFSPDAPELGYVAVDSRHQGNSLSHRMVAALLSDHQGFIFATTSNDRMKKTLSKAGFVQKGQEWKGQTGRLSLWIKQ